MDDDVIADLEGGLIFDKLLYLLVKLLFGDAGLDLQKVQRLKAGGVVAQGGADLVAVAAVLLDVQRLQHRRVVALMLKGVGVENHAAADGLQRGVKAQNKAVAGLDGDLLLQAQLGVAAFPGADRIAVEQHHLAQDVPRAVVEVQAGGV